MFERYTEKARRVIFFARYEASQYGSPYIETEHLLLGLLREDGLLVRHFLPKLGRMISVREEIDSHTEKRARIPTNVEVPLSTECQHILKSAVQEAGRLVHRDIGTEHLLLGILDEEQCFAARILKAKGADLVAIRTALPHMRTTDRAVQWLSWRTGDVKEIVAKFVSAWSVGNAKAFSEWFVEDGVFVDTAGVLWKGQVNIQTGAALHFASRTSSAPKGRLEELHIMTGRTAVAIAVFGPSAAEDSATERVTDDATPLTGREDICMTISLVEKGSEWLVVVAHVTEIKPTSAESTK